jgi:hypothetical protein
VRAGPRAPRCAGAAVGALLVAASPRLAAAPSASCQADRAGARARVQLVLADLFDRELLHLVRLGLRGKIRVEATLFRHHRFWFDERRATDVREVTVGWSKEARAYTLDGAAVADPGHLTVAPLWLRPAGEPLGEGAHYVSINARLEVVTVRSLGQVASWLVRGTDGKDEGGSALSRSLVAYVAADLARTAAASCGVR